MVFAYSDVPHTEVMHKASLVLAAGADFRIIGPTRTQIRPTKPVVSVCAVRTGAGKSAATRRIAEALQELGYRVVAIRHPMPYGNLAAEAVERFETLEDLERQECTIEEREEYEAHIMRNIVVYAGVDYEGILPTGLARGGYHPVGRRESRLFVLPLRSGRRARGPAPRQARTRLSPRGDEAPCGHVLVISKVATAKPEAVELVRNNIRRVNSGALIIEAATPITVDGPPAIRGRRVLVVEDGPTLTHGEMAHGAGYLAARRHGGRLVDPRPYVVGSVAEAYKKYKTIGPVVPAVGYGPRQVQELEKTIGRTPSDLVLIATPIDLRHILQISQPTQRVWYELREISSPTLVDVLRKKFGRWRDNNGHDLAHGASLIAAGNRER
jgi:predicted GTPase